ncbi:MAG: zinc ribbon domain-containing protein [Candidatus Nanoarchaeia archaeon]|jgi:predicted amidophosphoribosyltransferase|nr:zinc ribbon domain-containing protein [Candidatus Nanoarchaeia archaeon]|tara:strand:- start:38959 stop:39186 length:228 start_codon:yes stop_codon:yes gene_type:complete
MKCYNCEASLKKEFKFCPECGYKSSFTKKQDKVDVEKKEDPLKIPVPDYATTSELKNKSPSEVVEILLKKVVKIK